jgi:hypothetical protein
MEERTDGRTFDWYIYIYICIYIYNKPSLIQLQLIQMSDNPDRSMKNAVHSRVHTSKDRWDLGRRRIRSRGLSDCVEGSWRDWHHARKYLGLAWSWMKETLDFSSWQRNKFLQRWYFFLFTFISTTRIIKFSIFFIFFVFRAISCFNNLDYLLIWMTCLPINQD